ncbi:aspartate kinase [Sediminibacterium goheungense]|uniref:Aspartokinase n=1 Tax=Sediminibacterium goheungense TaxID=1086393 RepID=A0A4R6J062_9BACT|nr:aspartate kinase [Sediminibacterium goheungense]TDO28121.1 aspartate kinase [Sediminibacterium goheungense]
MKVFKFGGASVNSVERIKNLTGIVKQYQGEQLVIIISAMGKTTNALEKVVEAFYAGKKEEALQLFEIIKNQHLTTAKYLLVTHYNACAAQLNDFFTEVEWLLHDKPVREFDYYYDQVVCAGELLSTCIISHYLNQEKIPNQWADVRDIIRTDDHFRDAGIDWHYTTEKATQCWASVTASHNILITQGFIGSTDENESTTLGREGSDYTAALFANILNAESVTIWKDVEGVMNADPKKFPDAQLISELNFNEVIEMAFYGAQVIHPKTIKPLQNKGIPMYVKCFLDPSLPGTVIHKKNVKNLPPIIVVKENQLLVHLNSRDFSFMGEAPMQQLYSIFAEARVRPNLIQTGAIGVQICMDDKQDKTEQFASMASTLFDVQLEKNLQLLTIRHYNEPLVATMLEGKEVILTQKTKETVQIIFKI